MSNTFSASDSKGEQTKEQFRPKSYAGVDTGLFSTLLSRGRLP